ncbi:hypothetical protein [Scytonema hofmannii]|uniref:hypothetical protein n=1 Tax=Scytonema hofmannii TaxID=34078 RepID=UPI001314BEDF|nr:hypothetical protein [Scytonema hofmannii]
MLIKFEQALSEYPQERPHDVHPMLWHAERRALESQVEGLRDKIKEWERRS